MELYNALLRFIGKNVRILAYTDAGIITLSVVISEIKDSLNRNRWVIWNGDSIVMTLRKDCQSVVTDTDTIDIDYNYSYIRIEEIK